MTDENEAEVTGRMHIVTEALRAAGHAAYCQSLDPRAGALQSKGVKALLDYAFEMLATCDGLVAIVASERKSEGLLMEVGAALSHGQPVYLFLHESVREVPSHLPKVATALSVWRTNDDLQAALAKLEK